MVNKLWNIKPFSKSNLIWGVGTIVFFLVISIILINLPCSKGSFLILSVCGKDIIFIIINIFGSTIIELLFPKNAFSTTGYQYAYVLANFPFCYLLGMGFKKIIHKLRNIKLFIWVILISVFITSQIVVAYGQINSEINVYTIDKEGNFNYLNIDDLELKYLFDTSESLKRIVGTNQKTTIDLKEELFCWRDCNVVPLRTLERIEIKKGDEVISSQDTSIKEQNFNQIINIIQDKKIRIKPYVKNHIPKDKLDSLQDINGDLLIFWNGTLSIESNHEYHFFVNITGGLSVYINDMLIYSNPTENTLKNFLVTLEEGNHSLNLIYWTNINSKPNLYWKKDTSFDYEIIPHNILKFSNGIIEKIIAFDSKREFMASSFPGSYTPDYSTYPTGTLYYFQINSGRVPILLVHGLNGKYPYWNKMHINLNNLDNDVWSFYYSPSNTSNFMTAGLLKNGINTVLGYYSVSKLDVVSHSMGGLVTLGYIENLGKSLDETDITYGDNIRKYVIIGAPLHGSYLANRVLQGETSIGTCPGSSLFDPEDSSAQAYLDSAVGSEFSWLLNKNSLNNINYLSITGNEGIVCVPDETKESNSGDPGAGSDGLIAVASASLLDKGIPLVVLDDYNHANEIGQAFTCLDSIGCAGQCQNYLFGILCSNTDKEVNIINAFLNGANIIPYLEANDYYIDTSDNSSNPFNRGSVILKINPVDYANSVSIKNSETNEFYNLTKFSDTLHNTETHNWYYFSNNDSDMGYSNQKYGLILPKARYEVYVNDEFVNQHVDIYGAQTTMKEIFLDTDGDGVNDNEDACPSTYGTWCHGCPQPDCGICKTASCPSPPSVPPRCTNDATSVQCSSNFACSFGVGDNYYNIGGEYSCQGYCDGSGNCDYADICSYSSDCDPDDDDDGDLDITDCDPLNNTIHHGATELCNGIDEDCDGVLDGSESLTQQCGSLSIGICTYGTETCDDDGNWINCNAIFPQEEVCNNSIDENCDGFDEPCPIYCTINLPQNNNYSERRIPFNITLLEENEYLKYIDYADNRPRESTLCRRCDEYGSEITRHKTFSDGYHDISIFTTDGLCNESVEFFVDSKEPIISKTEPRRGFSDGNFYVEFTEDYPESLILTYGNSFKNESVDLNTCYEAGRRIACDVNVNLDEFEGKEINYWFTLVDIAGNLDESRINTLEVDQTDPKINYLNFDIDRRRVTFNISITEKNFDYVEYLDNEDRIPRWRTLCSRLKDDICLKTKSFRSGLHDLSFNVTDEAGNYVIPDNIAFTII